MSRSNAMIAAFFFMGAFLCLQANPTDPTVVAGDVSFATDISNLLEIKASDQAVIEWKDFSIAEEEITRFIQPSISSMVLNRVITGNPSQLLGRLEANGQLYLVNPNGILVGEKAVIDTNSFFAFTFDIGNDFTYTKPEIQETSFDVVINHKGRIDALGSKEEGGRVFLIAPQGIIDVAGSIHVPENGKIEISARQTLIEEQASLKINTQEREMGGDILVWGDEVSLFRGTATTHGGLIEISSPGMFEYTGQASGGTLLLDPSMITISLAGPNSPAFTFPIYNPVAAVSTLAVATLVGAGGLGLGSVTLRTSAGSGGDGSITVASTVGVLFTWVTGSTLTFEPDGDLILNGLVNPTGAGNITVNAGGTVRAVAAGIDVGLRVATGTITVNAANLYLQGGTAGGAEGKLEVTSTGTVIANISNDVFMIGGSAGGANALIGGFTSCTLTLDIGGSLTQTAGTLGSSSILTTMPAPLTTIHVGGDYMLTALTSTAQCQVQTLALDVGNNLTVTTAAAAGIARIITYGGGDANVNVGGNVTTNNMGEISAGVNLNLFCGGNIFLNEGQDGPGNIDSVGKLDITCLGNMTMTGTASVKGQNPFVLVGGNLTLSGVVGPPFFFASSIGNDGTGLMEIIVGNNFELLEDAVIFGQPGPINLVCDNDFPKPPGIGPSRFIVAPGASIQNFGGATRIFTARRSQNSIEGLINGLPFVPGPEFVNSTTEMWGIWYPHNSGIPFTIFYKNIAITSSVISDFYIAAFEYLQNLGSGGVLTEFDFKLIPFCVDEMPFGMLRPTVPEIKRGKIIP